MGYRLEPFFREDYVSSAKLQRVLRNRGITDIILGPILDESFKVELDWENFICIQLLPGFFPLPLHVVMRDHFNIVIMTWEKCVSRGYKRIGITLLNHRNRLMDDVVRMSAVDACQKYMFSHLPAIAPHHFEENNWREKEFILWVKKNRLDVVIGFNDYALLLLDQGFGRGFPFCSLNIVPPETSSGVTEASEDQGREAINLLHFCRRTNQWGLPEHRIGHVIEPQWTEGASLPLKKDVVFSYPYARAEGTSDG
jgi:LacI family transcriptional regulator